MLTTTEKYTTHELSIVHDWVIVVRHPEALCLGGGIGLQGKPVIRMDVFVVNADVIISIRTLVLVYKADGVAQLVNDGGNLEMMTSKNGNPFPWWRHQMETFST